MRAHSPTSLSQVPEAGGADMTGVLMATMELYPRSSRVLGRYTMLELGFTFVLVLLQFWLTAVLVSCF